MLKRDAVLVSVSLVVAFAVVIHMVSLEMVETTSPILISLVGSVVTKAPPRTLLRTTPPPEMVVDLSLMMNDTDLSDPVAELEEEKPMFVDARKPKIRVKRAAVAYNVDPATFRQRQLLFELGGIPRTVNFSEWKNRTAEAAAFRGELGLKNSKNTKHCRESSHRGTPKYFATSDRKDYNGFVAQELGELGLCRAKDVYAHGIDFYFGEQFDAEHAPDEEWARHFSPFFNPGAAVSSIPGLMRLFGSKDAYSNIWWKCKDFRAVPNHTKIPLCDPRWLPSFNVNGEEQRSKVAFRSRQVSKAMVPNFQRLYSILKKSRLPSFWIVKPQKGTYESRGMHLAQLGPEHVTSDEAFIKWLSNSLMDPACKIQYDKIRCDRRMMTYQYYVHNPLLYMHRKFDLRIWLLITSIDPLRVYLLRHAYPKVSTKPYDIFDIEDQCKHIRMLLDPTCMVDPDDFYTSFPNGYPKSTASPLFFDGLAAHLRDDNNEIRLSDNWPATEHWWSETIWPSVELAFQRLLMLVRPSLVKMAKKAEADEVQLSGDEDHNPHRRFALLSPDLAIDRKGNVYIEEVNMNGMIMGTHIRQGGAGDVFTDDDYLKHAFLLVGVNDFPHRVNYDDKLNKAIKNFCDNLVEPCTPAQINELKTSVHEEAHAGANWYRLYPPLPCFPTSDELASNTSPCVPRDDQSSPMWWPDQAKVSPEMRTALQETPLDATLWDFHQSVDTTAIHGHRPIPGHGRWGPRNFAGFEARP